MTNIPASVTGFGRDALKQILKGGCVVKEVGVDGITGDTNMLVYREGSPVAEFTKEEMADVNLSDPHMRRELGFY